MRTVTAMFDSRAEAEAARERLARAGIGDSDIAIHDAHSLGKPATGNRETGQSEGFADVQRPPGGVYGAEFGTTTDYAGNVGLRQREAEAESAPTHRNALGDFVDDRTGKNVADKEDRLHRTALGDFVDDQGHRLGHDEDAHADHDHRGAWDKIVGFFSGDSHVYEEGLRRGGHLLTVHVADGDVDRASEILDEDGVVDLDERQASWRNQGWSGAATEDSPTGRPRVRSYSRD